MQLPARGVAALDVAIRFAAASIIRCRSADLVGLQPNFRLPPVSTMRRAPAMPHSVSSLPPSKRHTRLTIVRRGCNMQRNAGVHGEAMYTALTLRSVCSSSSLRPAMSGVEGPSPRVLLGVQGGHSLTRENGPLSRVPTLWGLNRSPAGCTLHRHHAQRNASTASPSAQRYSRPPLA